MSDDATIREILGGLGPEEMCPMCNQKFTDIEEHIIEAHTGNGSLNVGFVRWLMRIYKDLEKVKENQRIQGD